MDRWDAKRGEESGQYGNTCPPRKMFLVWVVIPLHFITLLSSTVSLSLTRFYSLVLSDLLIHNVYCREFPCWQNVFQFSRFFEIVYFTYWPDHNAHSSSLNITVMSSSKQLTLECVFVCVSVLYQNAPAKLWEPEDGYYREWFTTTHYSLGEFL